MKKRIIAWIILAVMFLSLILAYQIRKKRLSQYIH